MDFDEERILALISKARAVSQLDLAVGYPSILAVLGRQGPTIHSRIKTQSCCGPEGLVERSGVWAECWFVRPGGLTSREGSSQIG
jgi:hypothetical protein